MSSKAFMSIPPSTEELRGGTRRSDTHRSEIASLPRRQQRRVSMSAESGGRTRRVAVATGPARAWTRLSAACYLPRRTPEGKIHVVRDRRTVAAADKGDAGR